MAQNRDVFSLEDEATFRSHLERVFERIDDAFYAVDDEFRFVYVNERAEELLQHSEEELLGETLWEVFPEAAGTDAWESFHTALETQEPTDYELYFEPLDFWVEANVYPSETGVSVYFRDVTEQKKREQALREERNLIERIVETSPTGIVTLDADGTFDLVNDRAEEILGYPADELEELVRGTEGLDPITPDGEPFTETEIPTARVFDGETIHNLEMGVRRADGDRVWLSVSGSPLDDTGEITRAVFTFADITDRIEYEHERENRACRQEGIASLGQEALAADTSDLDDLDGLMHEASQLVAEMLDTDYSTVFQLDSERSELWLREGVGWSDDVVGTATVRGERNSQAGYTLLSEGPVVVEDLVGETRFTASELLTDRDVVSGISTIIGSHEEPWGILGIYDTERRTFTEDDVNFVQSVANVLATAIDRTERERELERQREHLAAVNDLNDIVRETTDAVVEQSTREEIERIVCDRLADSDGYRFAWIGEADRETQTVDIRTETGAERYLEDISISIDPEDEEGSGPTGRALQTREIQTTTDVLNDPAYEPWREHAIEHGFRSSISIPIVYEQTLYGVLNVYAKRPYAFEGEERAVIGQLGEIIGHAFAAVERKRALMSDEVVELEVAIPDRFETTDVSVPTEEGITFDQTIPIGDDTHLVYGTGSPKTVDALEALVDEEPSFDALNVFSEGTDEVRFELRMADPPVLSAVASLGGYIDRALIEGGEYRLTVQLSPSTDPQNLIEEIRTHHSDATVLAHRQVTRSTDPKGGLERTWTEELTDRQRTALEVAYSAGYFEWPRESTGNELAESIGLAAPTFHEHLRAAENKVFAALITETSTPA